MTDLRLKRYRYRPVSRDLRWFIISTASSMILLGVLKITSRDKAVIFHVPMFVFAILLLAEGTAMLVSVLYFPRDFRLPADVDPHDRKAVHAAVKEYRQNRRHPECSHDETSE